MTRARSAHKFNRIQMLRQFRESIREFIRNRIEISRIIKCDLTQREVIKLPPRERFDEQFFKLNLKISNEFLYAYACNVCGYDKFLLRQGLEADERCERKFARDKETTVGKAEKKTRFVANSSAEETEETTRTMMMSVQKKRRRVY